MMVQDAGFMMQETCISNPVTCILKEWPKIRISF